MSDPIEDPMRKQAQPTELVSRTVHNQSTPAEVYLTQPDQRDLREINRLQGDAELQGTPAEGNPTQLDQRRREVERGNKADELPRLPGYEVAGEIARGGMGRVLLARDLTLKRDVAIKVLLHGTAGSGSRFIRESIITARLPHPGIPPVHAMGSLADGRPFLAMKLIRGRTLASLLQDRPNPRHELPRVVQIFEQVCQAVGFAHRQGIIHRDLKPSNIMVGAFGEVQVMDWGLARELAGQEGESSDKELASGKEMLGCADQTLEGSVMGTLAYMPPEQARGELEKLGTQSDVFALGGILCDILTGRPPYVGLTTESLLHSASRAELQDAFTRLDACEADGDLVALCKETLSPQPANRPVDGKAVADAVAAYRAGQEERARKAETERAAATARAEEAVQRAEAEERARLAAEAQAAEQRKRQRVQLMLAGTAALLLAAIAGFAWWDDRQAERRKLERSEAEMARAKANAKVELQQQAERERQHRNRDIAAALLSRVEKALEAGDAPSAAVAYEQTQKRIEEEGTEDLRERANRCRVELAMLQKLDRVDSDRWTVVDGRMLPGEALASRWADAFASYGIIPGTTSPEEARQRIEDSFIRERLLTSLEVWFVFSGKIDLQAILAAADPDEFRNEARSTNYRRAVLSWAFRGKSLPSSQPIWFALGHGNDRKLDREPREQLLLAAYRARPNSFPLLMSLGILDEFGDKEAGFRRTAWNRAAVAVQPHNVIAWNNLGNALKETGDLAGSIVSYREAIRLDPKYVAAYTNLGVALKNSTDLMGSIACQKEAIRLDPKFAPAHHNLGNALKDSGDWTGAIASYKEAIRLDPNLALAHYNLGLALRGVGDRAGAIASYKEAIRLDPKYAPSHNNLGNALRDSGDRTEAIACLKEAVRLDPKYVAAHTNLGIALRDSGDWTGAIACHKEAIRLDPKFVPAYHNLGALYLELKKYAEASECAREAIQLDPKISNSHALLGFALHRMGDIPGARVALTEAARINPKRWGQALAELPPIAIAPTPREVMH